MEDCGDNPFLVQTKKALGHSCKVHKYLTTFPEWIKGVFGIKVHIIFAQTVVWTEHLFKPVLVNTHAKLKTYAHLGLAWNLSKNQKYSNCILNTVLYFLDVSAVSELK